MATHPQLMGRLSQPTADEPIQIAVVADPHVAVRSEMTTKLFDKTRDHFAAALADAEDRGVDAVLSPGDLTKDGEPWNFETVDDLLENLEVPFLSVPGNHDVPKSTDEHEALPVPSFAARYATGEFPFIQSVGGIDVVGLNSAGTAEYLYESHAGGIPEDRLPAVEAALAEATNPVVLMHHNLPAMYDRLRDHRDAVDREMGIPPKTRDSEDLLSAFAAADIPLVLTGHLHIPETVAQHGVREVMAPTTCSYPQGYLLLDIDEGGTEIGFVPVDDREGLRLAHAIRSQDSPTSRGLAAMASVNLAQFPLVRE